MAHPTARTFLLLAASVLAFLALACGSGAQTTAEEPTAAPTPVPTSVVDVLRRQAETTHLPKLPQELQDFLRSQPWYLEPSQQHLGMIASMVKAHVAAKAKGEPASVPDMFTFATEQGWYGDGLEPHEAAGLGGMFEAYAVSLTKPYAPAIGAMISTTIRYQLFSVVTLPETGDKVVLVASRNEALGRKALDIAVDSMPKIEGIIGKFPYPFLYFEVTDNLPDVILGTSYDEFIEIASGSVDAETIVHEITHSTAYGLFPLWFEEGLAHFMEFYLTEQIESESSLLLGQFARLRATVWLDVRAINYTLGHEIAERAGGFLVLKSLYDIHGIEGMGALVRSLRTKKYNDQELVAAIYAQASPEAQPRVRQLFCDRVAGTTRNYCTN